VVAEVIIEMKPSAFEPQELTIRKNTRVIFKNDDQTNRWPASNIHPTHGIYPEFDPQKPVAPGESWSFVFDKVGTWKCHDHILPRLTCVIRVE
jgi:plastocyanin